MKPSLLLTWGLLVVLTGCATSGRRVLLKEYGPTVEARPESPLRGVAICVCPFEDAFKLENTKVEMEVHEPASFTLKPMTPSDQQQWDKDVGERKRTSDEKAWPQIGYVRNLYGMIMSKVYALNPPAEWLAETLKLDLKEQGAVLVEAGATPAPSAQVSGTVKLFKIDLYMKYTSDVIVDLRIAIPGRPAIERTVHCRAGDTAYSGSSWEYYQSLRPCQQKFSRIVIEELEKALKP